MWTSQINLSTPRPHVHGAGNSFIGRSADSTTVIVMSEAKKAEEEKKKKYYYYGKKEKKAKEVKK
jgi:hypothetical protein